MTVALKNQYICKFDIGDIKDFIQTEDLKSLLYVEDAKMALPAFEMTFTLRDDKIIDYINMGSVLTLGIGMDELSMLDIRFRIITDFKSKRPSVGQNIVISGVYYDYNFVSNGELVTYKDLTSLEVVQQEAKRYFPKLETNLEKTNDRQSWQKFESGWSFLKRVCAKGYLNDKTFLISAFDNDTFYYYDYRKLLAECANNPSSLWVLSKSATSGRNGRVLTYNNAVYSGDSGVTSQVLGHLHSTVEYDWENYNTNVYIDNVMGFTSLDTNALPLAYTGSMNFNYASLSAGEPQITNMAITQNSKNIILNSNVMIFITLGGQFKKLRLLDPVLIDNTGDRQITGVSIIAKIAYQIVNQQLFTNITLVRESFNNLKGDDLQDGSV
jgi:hypothetical protein